MKKIFFILLFLTLIFALCSCSCALFDTEGEDNSEQIPGADEPIPDVEELSFEKTADKRYYVVTGIGSYTGEDIVIPKLYNGRAVKSIAADAFKGNTNIKTLTVEEGVEKIGSGAFSGCTSLESVRIAPTLEKMDSSVFEGCASLKNLIFGKGVTDIGKNAFFGCSAIESFYYEGTLADYGRITGITWCELDYKNMYIYSASYPSAAGYFWHWSEELEPLVWVDYIGNTGLRFEISEDGTYYKVTGNSNPSDKSVLIPKAHAGLPVGEIDAMAFVNAYMEEIIIPETVTKISGAAFRWCSKLKSVKHSDSIEIIGESAFSGCTSLEAIKLPEALTEIGSSAFVGCTALKSIEIPNGVKTVGSEAFYGCTALASVRFGTGVEAIGERAFNLCNSLKGVVIPHKVTTLSDGVFGDCMDMEYAVIHGGVTDIGRKAFFASVKIYYTSNPESWSKVNKAEGSVSESAVYFYSSSKPDAEGKFWYINDDGEIAVW